MILDFNFFFFFLASLTRERFLHCCTCPSCIYLCLYLCQFSSKNLKEIKQFDSRRKNQIPKAIESEKRPRSVCHPKDRCTGSIANPGLPGLPTSTCMAQPEHRYI